MNVTDTLRSERIVCNICKALCTDDQRVIKKNRLKKIKLESGEPPTCLCKACYKLKSNKRALLFLDSLSILRMRIASATDLKNISGLTLAWHDLKDGKDILNEEITELMKQLNRLVDANNAISRMFSECSTTLGGLLWNTYPERRKRANYRISEKHLRLMIFYRDGNKCVQCPATSKLTIDHIIPVLRGGSDEPENLQTLCRSCNSQK